MWEAVSHCPLAALHCFNISGDFPWLPAQELLHSSIVSLLSKVSKVKPLYHFKHFCNYRNWSWNFLYSVTVPIVICIFDLTKALLFLRSSALCSKVLQYLWNNSTGVVKSVSIKSRMVLNLKFINIFQELQRCTNHQIVGVLLNKMLHSVQNSFIKIPSTFHMKYNAC